MSSDDDDEKQEGFSEMISDAIGSIPFFLMFITIILYIISYSNSFNRTLQSMDDALIDEDGGKSNKGVIVTGIAFGVILSVLQAMKNGNLI